MKPTRRNFIKSSAGLVGSLALGGPLAWARGSGGASRATDGILHHRELDFPEAEKARLSRLMERGLLEIDHVLSIPEDQSARLLGWPVATRMRNGRAVVAFRRHEGHGHPEEGTPHTGRFVLYSDNLGDWKPAAPIAVGPTAGMHCLGAVPRPDGEGERLLLVAGHGPNRLYLSDDGGETWRRRDPFAGMLRGAAHVGPNLMIHPEFGAVFASGQETGRGGRNFLLRSPDGGETWEERVWMNTGGGRAFEPAGATWGPGHMVLVGRESHSSFAMNPRSDPYWAHTQHVYRHRPGAGFQEVQFSTSRTNIVGNPAARQAEGLGPHDTADVIYNPVSRRVEVLESHRWGGGENPGTGIPRNIRDERSTLNIWSMDPDELLAGGSRWRFDGTVIERIGFSRRGNKDGLHPGGSIIDLERNMQHIFVYAGWRRAPASIFRISRTLDTAKWREFM